MRSESRVKTGRSRGRLIHLITLTFLSIALIPVAIMALVIFSYQQTWFSQPYAAFLQYALVLLGVAAGAAVLGTWIAARRSAAPILKLKAIMQQFAAGDWEQRLTFRRKDELGELAEVFNQIADDYYSTYQSLALRDATGRNGQDQALPQIASAILQARSRSDLLERALESVARSYSVVYGRVYTLEWDELHEKRFAALEHEYRLSGFNPASLGEIQHEGRVNLEAVPTLDWLVSRAIAKGEILVEEVPTEIGLVEAALPLARLGRVTGVLDLFAHNRASDLRLGPFSPRALAELEKIAGLIALAEASFENQTSAAVRLPGPAELKRELGDAELEQALLLYQAGNWITQAETEEAALTAVRQSLAQIPYPTAILLAPDDGSGGLMRLAHRSDQAALTLGEAQPIGLSAEQATRYFNRSTPTLVADLGAADMPQALLELARELGCESAAFVPALRGGLVSALLVLGRAPANNMEAVNPSAGLPVSQLGPYLTLVELLVASLEKIRAQRHTQRQLAELRTFWNVSQAISLETDLNPLFMTIHHQVESVIGELNSFAIAFYDGKAGTIAIPYMVEEGRTIEIAPFPLGEGLTSILVKTRKPLLLVDDVEAQSKALGAKVQGAPAKSWLGVPMIYSGEVIGAIIVQDINQEKRFSEQDERLLSALASQVAVVVRNARLLEASRLQAQHEHLLNEITAKIRRSPDIQSILKTTASELGTALGVRRAYIRLGVEPEARTVETEAER